VLREFLDPRNWRPPEDRKFALDASQISELCDEAESIFKDEPSVLKLQGPLQHPLFPTLVTVELDFLRGSKSRHGQVCGERIPRSKPKWTVLSLLVKPRETEP